MCKEKGRTAKNTPITHCKTTATLVQCHCNTVAVTLQSSCSITANIFAVTLHSICSTTAKRMQQECSNNALIISQGFLFCKYLMKPETAFEHERKKPYICSKLKNRESNEEVDYI